MASVLVAAAVVLGAVPTAGLAVTAVGGAAPGLSGVALFTPSKVDPAVSRRIAANVAARAQAARFAKAGNTLDSDRTVTVAIRVGEDEVRAVSVRRSIAAATGAEGAGPSLAALAPARYNLGLSRGYKSFAKPAEPKLNIRQIDMPDLATFRPSDGVKETPGRLQPRIALESDTRTGRSPRTLEGAGEQAVDLGAGYRLSRNLDVTAGVRLSQERDRLAPLTDAIRDDQAVYIGTQFRF